MNKPLIVVTGKNGQLGWELERLHAQYSNRFDFYLPEEMNWI